MDGVPTNCDCRQSQNVTGLHFFVPAPRCVMPDDKMEWWDTAFGPLDRPVVAQDIRRIEAHLYKLARQMDRQARWQQRWAGYFNGMAQKILGVLSLLGVMGGIASGVAMAARAGYNPFWTFVTVAGVVALVMWIIIDRTPKPPQD